MKYFLAALAALCIAVGAFAQEKAQRVTGKLPAKAVCFICSQNGETEEEKPAGAVAYKGKTYYFCNKGEVEKFLKDPESFIPAPVPRVAPAFTLKTPTGETVTLDFNLAYNPYCAYANHWSCPIPPLENRLAIAIRAGEKLFGDHA